MNRAYNKDRIRKFIIKVVKDRQDLFELNPKFYVISGSHIYGFDDESSDVDIRGVHIADGTRYALLEEPVPQITVNQGEKKEFENYPRCDLCSYELKKFGKLIHGMNFNVLEWLFHGEVVMNGIDLELDVLRSMIKEHLPANVPYAYEGMAKNNYHKYLNSNKESYTPSPKKFLYVIRGLLGASYVMKEKEIEPDIRVLAEKCLETKDLEVVNDLIEFKKNSDRDYVGTQLRRKAHSLIESLFKGLDIDIDIPEQKKGLREEIDDWMLKVRE